MKRHYPYHREERHHFAPNHRAGEIVDAIWDSYKQEQRLEQAYMKRKAGKIPWVDPNERNGRA